METTENRFIRSGIFVLLVIGSAVAAFGLTFHFFGQSELVPAPSRQFGFWALAPLGVIDRVYTFFSGERLLWYPIPMFIVLWISYSFLASVVAMILTRRKRIKM